MGDWRDCGIAQWDADCAVCYEMLSARMIDEGNLTWAGSLSRPMFLCPNCGSKRCPKAAWHMDPCAGASRG